MQSKMYESAVNDGREKMKKGKAPKVSATEQTQNAKDFSANESDNVTRVKSEFAKSLERVEERVSARFSAELEKEFAQKIGDLITEELQKETETQSDESTKAKLLRIATKGKEETENFTLRHSDTENGIQTFFAFGVHDQMRAASQSLLKVLIKEREERKQREEETKQRATETLAKLGAIDADTLKAMLKLLQA